MQSKLTERFIRDVKPAERDSFYWDTQTAGLGLKVTKNGAKRFVFQYRPGKGRQSKVKRVNLGEPSEAYNLEAARAEAVDYRQAVRRGDDPAAIISAKKIANDAKKDRTFSAFLENVFVGHAEKNMRSAGEILRVLRREFVPLWKDRDIGEIRRSEIKEALAEIVTSGRPHLANKGLDCLRMIFKEAVEREKIPVSPVNRMARPHKTEAGGRGRVLSDAELIAVWKAAEQEPYPYGPYIKTLILTLARRSEVAGMRANELNRKDSQWEIPGERSKNGKPLIIPLPEAVWSIIDEAKTQATGRKGLIFTTNGKVPISGFSKYKRGFDERLKEVEPWRLHDLRRTGATGFARMGVPPDITDRVLNHVPHDPTGTRAVYDKWGYLPEKTDALNKWADYVLAAVAAAESDNVVPIKAKSPQARPS